MVHWQKKIWNINSFSCCWYCIAYLLKVALWNSNPMLSWFNHKAYMGDFLSCYVKYQPNIFSLTNRMYLSMQTSQLLNFFFKLSLRQCSSRIVCHITHGNVISAGGKKFVELKCWIELPSRYVQSQLLKLFYLISFWVGIVWEFNFCDKIQLYSVFASPFPLEVCFLLF